VKNSRLPVNPHSVYLKVTPENRCIRWFRNNFKPAGDFNLIIDSWTFFYGEPAPAEHLALARNKALRNLIQRAELGIEANLAQDFAQIGQTTRMIGLNARKIARSLLLLKKGNFPSAIKALTAGRTADKMPPRKGPSASKNLAENWLELQYGWKPLLKDIEGAFNALSKLQGADQLVHRVTASARHRWQSVGTYNSTEPLSQVKGNASTFTDTSCRFVLKYKIDDRLKSFLAQTGFTNPVNLSWEILPFSFVVDWFLPIGPFLETLSAWDGLQFMEGSQTLFTRQEAVSTISGSSRFLNSGTDNLYEEHGAIRQIDIKLDRTRLTAFPTQTFPSFKNGLASVDHALNGIALLKAVFGR